MGASHTTTQTFLNIIWFVVCLQCSVIAAAFCDLGKGVFVLNVVLSIAVIIAIMSEECSHSTDSFFSTPQYVSTYIRDCKQHELLECNLLPLLLVTNVAVSTTYVVHIYKMLAHKLQENNCKAQKKDLPEQQGTMHNSNAFYLAAYCSVLGIVMVCMYDDGVSRKHVVGVFLFFLSTFAMHGSICTLLVCISHQERICEPTSGTDKFEPCVHYLEIVVTVMFLLCYFVIGVAMCISYAFISSVHLASDRESREHQTILLEYTWIVLYFCLLSSELAFCYKRTNLSIPQSPSLLLSFFCITAVFFSIPANFFG